MPPSTATQRETFCLTLSTRVQRHAGVRAQRPPRLDQQPSCRAALVRVVALDQRCHVLLDRRRRRLLGGVAHAEPTAEIPDGEVAELGELGDLAPETGPGSSS